MPAFMPAFNVSGVISAGTMAFGAAPAIDNDQTFPVALWNTVMKPLPPMPFISGSPSPAIAPTAAAASKALPPLIRICSPAADAIGCPVVTSPWRPATAGRVRVGRLEAGASAACCCPTSSAPPVRRTINDDHKTLRMYIGRSFGNAV